MKEMINLDSNNYDFESLLKELKITMNYHEDIIRTLEKNKDGNIYVYSILFVCLKS